ncbi:PLP-dependent aminotransferase family protein [Nocardiopsis sp. FIRDI 009]|uniref:MocR-like pyridoxine biosynthesis transcription factor PdxR n=1 Tax=Nocardiopsis sp. FIRDI 009 TaxID=714197 RepID=UPI000E228059|nr:PLP-dependent aminotransferase family protein [Nocardiopsis sp. FIRDI 009]
MNRSNHTQHDRSIGADFLHLDPADAPHGGLTDWLTDRIRTAITDGDLPRGSVLPATRTLAADLGVSRGVITEVYRRLAEDGHVRGQGRAGTVVMTGSATSLPHPHRPDPTAPRPLFHPTPGPEVFDHLRRAQAHLDLSPGAPDLAAFPRAAWLSAERSVLTDTSATELGYGDPRGTPALRSAVADWLTRTRGIRAHPDQVVIVAGTAQALALIARTLGEEGVDTVAVEDPGSLGVRQHLNHAGLRTPPVPVDEQGLDVDALRATGARAVLTTPAHQFPTGVVLSGDRRRALTRWAREGGLVIEDDYDAEHRYDRPPVPALASVVPDRVCYTGSVSKLLAPALRLGWTVAPPHLHDALVEGKRFSDLGNATLPQLTLARLMASGALERHLRVLRARHRRRRDTMIEALRAHLPGARVHGAAAGLHLTLTLDTPVPDTDLAALALERGVKTHPLTWHRQRSGPAGLVLGYAGRPETAIREGVAVLGAVVTDLAR